MERLEEIKKRRQGQFIMNRLKVGTANREEADLKEIKDFMHLIKAPHGKKWNFKISKFLELLILIKKSQKSGTRSPTRGGL